MKELYIGCDNKEDAREYLLKWISNQDKSKPPQHLSSGEKDMIIQYLLHKNEIYREMVENGISSEEIGRNTAKCSNSIHDFMMLDIKYGTDEQ